MKDDEYIEIEPSKTTVKFLTNKKNSNVQIAHTKDGDKVTQVQVYVPEWIWAVLISVIVLAVLS